ncbi:hypothetical protein HBI23_252780 [Parastagonospora nodorum]|nr:hypothetical protein HBI23_252780 [Parastagonospora nodorum]KAH5622253.1 hypothetical protein HBI51_247840 [Parastagonospora nodorum]KAH5983567.1 hypothetical protein HBI84_245990 [Parastagonospora nodorum]KAH6134160.1 hypothetical protein HBI68_250700 [Parastagonospora nodorum]KAH6383947.1 hypothetical protein HBI60_253110 [Parastagonospora nodorum]
MNPPIESRILKLRRFLTDDLNLIEGSFGKKSKEAWDNTLLMQLPIFADVKKRMGGWEEKTSPVDWDDLPTWIDRAVESFREQYTETVRLFEAMGLTASDINLDDEAEMVKQKIASSPCGQALRRWLGPNWSSCPEMNGIQSLGTSRMPVGPDGVALGAITKRKMDITALWEALKAARECGKLKSIRGAWDRLTTNERRKHLRQNFSQLHESAQADIYACIRSPTSQHSNIDKNCFLTPLLNVEDLCTGENLPNLLDSRATWHPGLFRTVDSRSVALGQHCKTLTLAIPGRTTFASGQEYHGTASYDIEYAKDCDLIQTFSPYTTDASRGILQLEAQKRTYVFLAACLDRLPVVHGNDNMQPLPDNYPSLSLLARASLLDFSGDPQHVDLRYLSMLLTSSKDLALDDLEQLRSDPDSFIEHWHETSQESPGRIANFLGPIFQRVDTFQSLVNLLDAIKLRAPFTTETAEGLTTLGVPDLMALHTALQSSLDDTLSNLKALSYSPARSDDSVFGKLFNMVKECNPTIWIMGLSSAMLVIDRELRNQAAVGVPLAVTQALNDVSVLAVCVRETWKQYQFDAGVLSSIHEANRLEKWWKQQVRPWLLLAEGGCEAAGETQRRKLENHLRRRDIHPSDRMCSFWNAIDKCMASRFAGNRTLELMQQRAPINPASGIQSLSFENESSLGATPTITSTKKKRSKKRQPLASSPSQLRTAPSASSAILMPVKIEPTQHLDFWRALAGSSAENNSSLRWPDFLEAMIGLGYKYEAQSGSLYRFEYVRDELPEGRRPGTIVFHRPHGDKVTHTQAQQWWLRRLLRRIQLIL